MSQKKKASRRCAVCIRNEGNEASLERNKLYVLLPDRQAEADGQGALVLDGTVRHHLRGLRQFSKKRRAHASRA